MHFGFWQPIHTFFGISCGILNPITDQVFCFGPFKVPGFNDQLRNLREGTHVFAPGLSVHVEKHQVYLVEALLVNAREIIQQAVYGFFVAEWK